jgi:hypothetical protein
VDSAPFREQSWVYKDRALLSVIGLDRVKTG